uniref:Zinc finger protein 605 n=1 Tax=Xenopus tropicalis TaxID=8364 RepID=A0A803JCH0_XENTR
MQGKERSATALDGWVATRQTLVAGGNQETDGPPGGAGGQYLCMECNETFNSKVQLSSHRQSHVAKKPFMCSYCGRGFHHQVFLQVHERSHEGGASSAHLPAAKPIASRVISTRSCRNVPPLTSNSVSAAKPAPSHAHFLLNSLVQFRQENGSQPSPSPRECPTRLSRCQPGAPRKDGAESRRALELRVSSFSDTTVQLIDAFGNSIELLTEVFGSYTLNGPKPAGATGTHVGQTEPLSSATAPCEQRSDRTQRDTLASSTRQSPPLPNTDTPTICPSESDLPPAGGVGGAAPSTTSEKMPSRDPAVPLVGRHAADPLPKETEPTSVAHYQTSTEPVGSMEAITDSSPPTSSQSVVPAKGHDGPGSWPVGDSQGTTSYETGRDVPRESPKDSAPGLSELGSLAQTEGPSGSGPGAFPENKGNIVTEQEDNSSLSAKSTLLPREGGVTSSLVAPDAPPESVGLSVRADSEQGVAPVVGVASADQAGGLSGGRRLETDHSEQVGETDTCPVGLPALTTNAAKTSKLDSRSEKGSGGYKNVPGQNIQSGVKAVSPLPVNIKLSLVRDAHSPAIVQGTETPSANIGASDEQCDLRGEDLPSERHAGKVSESDIAENSPSRPTKKADYVPRDSAASRCGQDPTLPEPSENEVSDPSSPQPDGTTTPGNGLNQNPAIVDHDYSDQRSALGDTPVLSSPITADPYVESPITTDVHDVPTLGEEKNNTQLGGQVEQEQHSLDKRPEGDIPGNAERDTEGGTALVLSRDGDPGATVDSKSPDMDSRDSALPGGVQPKRSEGREDISFSEGSRWVSPMEVSFQEKVVMHENEQGANAQTSHQNDVSPPCVGERSLSKYTSAPSETVVPNADGVALRDAASDEVELGGTVPCFTSGKRVKGNELKDSPSHVSSIWSKSSVTAMESESSTCPVKQESVESVSNPLEPEEPDEKANKMYGCPKCDKFFKLPVLLAGHMKCHALHLCVTCGSPIPHKYKTKRLAKKCQQCIQKTIVKRRRERLLFPHYSEEEEDEDMVTSGMDFALDFIEDADITLPCDPDTEGALGADPAPEAELMQLKRRRTRQRAKSAGSLGLGPSAEHSGVQKKRGGQPSKADLIPATVPKVFKCLQCGLSFLQSASIVKHMKEHSGAQTQPCKCYLIVRQGEKQILKKCNVCREHTKDTASDASQLSDSPVSGSELDLPTAGPKKGIKRARKGDAAYRRASEKKIPQKRGKYARKSMAPVEEGHDEPYLEERSQSPSLDGELISTSWEDSFGEESFPGRGSPHERSRDPLLKPHVCEVCGKSFRLPRYLQLHIVMHTGTPCESCGCLFRFKRRAGRHSKKCRLCRTRGKEQGLQPDTILAQSPLVVPDAPKAKVLSSLPHGKQSKAPNQAKRGKAFKEKKSQLLKGPSGQSRKRKLSLTQPEEGKKKPKRVEDLSPSTPKKRGRPPGKPSTDKMLSRLKTSAIKSESKSIAVSGEGLHPGETAKSSVSGEGKPIKSDEVPTYQILPTMSIKEEPNASEISSFLCSECGQNFPYKHLLDSHLQTHTGDRPFACPDCDKRFAKINHLTIHKRVHTGVRPHVCSVCNSSFRQKSSLLAHRYTHANQPPLLVTLYECSICLKEFKQSSDLEAHECSLPVEPPVQCKDCDRVFTNKGRLAVHSRVHTEQTSYPCPICERSFIYKANLERHQQKHKGEKPFSCAKCGVSFARRKTLERHKLAHGKKGLFSCTHCKKHFLLQSWLFRHMKICQGVGKGKVLKRRKKIKEDVEVSSTVSSEEAEKKMIKVENKEHKIKKLVKSKLPVEPKHRSKAVEGGKEEKLKLKVAKAEKGAMKKKLTESSQEKGEGSGVEEEKKRPNEEENVKRENKQEQLKKGPRDILEGTSANEGKPKARGSTPAKKDMPGEEKQKAKGATTAKKELDGEQKNVSVDPSTNKDLLGDEKPTGKGATTTKPVGEEKQKGRNVTPAKKELIGDEKLPRAKGTPPVKKPRLESNPKERSLRGSLVMARARSEGGYKG